jgi:predicted nucleic acid-binding Zn ribbon protein
MAERDGPAEQAAPAVPAVSGHDEETRRARLAREALGRAKADARAHGLRPVGMAAPVRRPGSAGAGTGQAPAGPGSAASGATPAGTASAGRASSAGGSAQGRPPLHEASRERKHRARPDEPQSLRTAIDGLLDEQGWREPVAIGSVFGRWAEIVGPELAAHSAPDHVTEGELTVTADSTAWATQLRLLAPQLLHHINAELRAGPGGLGTAPIRRVRVRGPAGPPRRPGEWRVRGSRGPRDTYG